MQSPEQLTQQLLATQSLILVVLLLLIQLALRYQLQDFHLAQVQDLYRERQLQRWQVLVTQSRQQIHQVHQLQHFP